MEFFFSAVSLEIVTNIAAVYCGGCASCDKSRIPSLHTEHCLATPSCTATLTRRIQSPLPYMSGIPEAHQSGPNAMHHSTAIGRFSGRKAAAWSDRSTKYVAGASLTRMLSVLSLDQITRPEPDYDGDANDLESQYILKATAGPWWGVKFYSFAPVGQKSCHHCFFGCLYEVPWHSQSHIQSCGSFPCWLVSNLSTALNFSQFEVWVLHSLLAA